MGNTPPRELTACVLGGSLLQQGCPAAASPLHRIRLDWAAPNVGSVASYSVYRVAGPVVTPADIVAGNLIGGAPVPAPTTGLVDPEELPNGVVFTYVVIATFTDASRSGWSSAKTDPAGQSLATITAVNVAPTAVADAFSTNEDTSLTAASVLVNDLDDNDHARLTAQLVSGPSHGALTFRPDGTFEYVPVADYNGPDSFTYGARAPESHCRRPRTSWLKVYATAVMFFFCPSISRASRCVIQITRSNTLVACSSTARSEAATSPWSARKPCRMRSIRSPRSSVI